MVIVEWITEHVEIVSWCEQHECPIIQIKNIGYTCPYALKEIAEYFIHKKNT